MHLFEYLQIYLASVRSRARAALRQRPPHWGRLVVVVLVGLGSVGCGFHLRGDLDVPEALRVLHLDASPSALADVVEGALSQAGVKRVERPEDAVLSLQLSGEREDRRTSSVTRGLQAAVYELIGEVRFQLADRDGKSVLPSTALRVVRTYVRDADNLLANAREEALLWREIRAEMAASLMRAVSVALVRQGELQATSGLVPAASQPVASASEPAR